MWYLKRGYSDGAIFNFQISGQIFINENCHNSRTSNYIGMKLERMAKLNKKTTTVAMFDDDVMSSN